METRKTFQVRFLTFRCPSENLEVFDVQVQMPRAIKLESGDSGINIFKRCLRISTHSEDEGPSGRRLLNHEV